MAEMKPLRPTNGFTSNDSGMMSPEISDTLRGVGDAAQNVLNAQATATVLEKLMPGNSPKSGSLEGIPEMMKASTDVLKGSTEITLMAIKSMLETKNGNGSSEIWQPLVMLMLTNLLEKKEAPKSDNNAMLLKLMEISENRWASLLESERSHFNARIDELKQNQGSPWDQMVMEKAMAELKKDPADDIKKIVALMELLQKLSPKSDNGDKMTMADKLTWAGIQKELESMRLDYQDKREERDARKEPPGWVEPVTQLFQGLNIKNFIPTNFATQADDDAGQAMMGG